MTVKITPPPNCPHCGKPIRRIRGVFSYVDGDREAIEMNEPTRVEHIIGEDICVAGGQHIVSGYITCGGDLKPLFYPKKA